MVNVDIDEPIKATSSAGSFEPDSESVSQLVEMGFTIPQAKKALRETVR
jgi:ubiquitin carboxyl-terminal hydrolase 5/13